MKLAFAGTPEFARVALEALHKAGHELALVLTQPDRPAGRGLQLQASPVKQFAVAHELTLQQPRGLRLDGRYTQDAQQTRSALEQARPDAMVVAAYGLILPQWVLDICPLGCFNIHASLLPRWRGAAPIQRAIQAGDTETGVTIMQMDSGLDTGAMLMAHHTPITPSDTASSLHDRLAELGARLMLLTLQKAEAGNLRPVPQDATQACYAAKIDKAEAAIDWRLPGARIVRHIHALNPAPGASTRRGESVLKIWRAALLPITPPAATAPGTILAAEPTGLAVAAIDSVVLLTELQRAGGKRLAAREFLPGADLRPGEVLT